MSSVSIIEELKSFLSTHKVPCILAVGLAVVGCLIGSLAGRVVSWIKEHTGTTKKADVAVRERLSVLARQATEDKPVMLISLPVISSSSTNGKNTKAFSRGTVKELDKSDSPESNISLMTDKIFTSSGVLKGELATEPPKEQTKIKETLAIGTGSIDNESRGWQIDVSMGAALMEQAIPITAREAARSARPGYVIRGHLRKACYVASGRWVGSLACRLPGVRHAVELSGRLVSIPAEKFT